jgi:hypothetical protein
MNLFERPACWYVSLAIVVSVYQAIRGIVFQTQYAEAQKKAQKHDDASTFALGAQSSAQIFLLRALSDGVLYLISTLAGFESLLLAYRILNRAPSLEAISGGAGAAFVFLALFGVLGATGQLPHLLQQGKWPR